MTSCSAQCRLCSGRASRTTHWRPGLGGDEFTVLLEGPTAETDASDVGHRLVEVLRGPIDLGGRSVFLSASVGVALSEPGQRCTGSLLRRADLALYHAKAEGKGRVAFFDPDLERIARARRTWKRTSARRSKATVSCRSGINRSCRYPRARSCRWKPCCAGCIPNAGWSSRASSSRSRGKNRAHRAARSMGARGGLPARRRMADPLRIKGWRERQSFGTAIPTPGIG